MCLQRHVPDGMGDGRRQYIVAAAASGETKMAWA